MGTKPDVKIISEVYLYALGFQHSKVLAVKLFTAGLKKNG